MFKEIKKCIICGNEELAPVLDLGIQTLTGVFPNTKRMPVGKGPLQLMKCREDNSDRYCGLVQLRHFYSVGALYGQTYGYRSGLNHSMVEHLHKKVKKILRKINLRPGDMIIDIGSNDSTLLQGYPATGLKLIGVDPLGEKMIKFYPPHIHLIADFFSKKAIEEHYGSQKAKIITSIAMFYDLERPIWFMRQIYELLADDGVWVFEQSYMPTMLSMNAYDTVCHEHLEYYRLKQIKWMADKVGLKILDVEFNQINGGSFSVTAARRSSPYREASGLVNRILKTEKDRLLHTLRPYQAFKHRVFQHKKKFQVQIRRLKKSGKMVLGYGASTKGNVILQFCELGEKDIPFIAEVNSDKFGAYTPGTLIPIISEKDARAMKPDYFVVLPWHFKDNIMARERVFLNKGGKLLFPLPQPEIVRS
ncbi:MAG: class I SAM-dependent methyltransferase [Candidatus Omnitrophica bacterium]|nr:class I SAM-dependent methyltransferase [Candidatus Omnitrophota bacterium]